MTYETEAELREEVHHLSGIIAGARGDDEQPIEGLPENPATLVHILEFAQGRYVKVPAIMNMMYWDRVVPPDDSTVRNLVFRIRKLRPDIGDRIESKSCYGYRLVPA